MSRVSSRRKYRQCNKREQLQMYPKQSNKGFSFEPVPRPWGIRGNETSTSVWWVSASCFLPSLQDEGDRNYERHFWPRMHDWMTKVDSKDLYLGIPMHEVDRSFFHLPSGSAISSLYASICSIVCTMCLYQDLPANCNSAQGARSEAGSIYLTMYYSLVMEESM